MNSAYSQEQAVDYSELTYSDGFRSDMWNGMITVNESLPPESETESYPTHLSLATSEHSSVKGTPQAIRDWLMSLRADSPASRSAQPGNNSEPMTKETCGPKQLSAFALFDLDTHSWRTFQACLLTGTLALFSETWPRQGTMQDGVCYRLAPLVRHTHGKGCSLWPTPLASEAVGGGSARMAQRSLNGEKRKSGASITLKVGDLLRLKYGIVKKSIFYEWLMGWVPKWSALEPLEMDKFRQWLEQHGNC